MEEPNYIVRANEGVRMPKNDTLALYYTKKVLGWTIVLLIVWSFVFRESLLRGMSMGALVLLVCAFLRVRTLTKEEFVPSPFELWFYTDYIVIYREKYYYHTKLSRKQYDKFYYKDIHQCLYHEHSHRMDILGIVEGIWYDYNKDGTVPDKPTYHKTTDSICYFYTNMAPEIDFVAELERHMPVKVTIRDN